MLARGEPEYSAKDTNTDMLLIHTRTYSSHAQEPKCLMWSLLQPWCLLKAALSTLQTLLRETLIKHHIKSCVHVVHYVIYSSTQPEEVNTASFILQITKLMLMKIKYHACGHACSLFFFFQCNMLCDQLKCEMNSKIQIFM